MNLIPSLISHFNKMYLIRKVLIAMGGIFFIYSVYSLIANGWQWVDNRGSWIVAASTFFIILSQFGSHLYNLKKERL